MERWNVGMLCKPIFHYSPIPVFQDALPLDRQRRVSIGFGSVQQERMRS